MPSSGTRFQLRYSFNHLVSPIGRRCDPVHKPSLRKSPQKMLEAPGIEPRTSSMLRMRSTNWATPPFILRYAVKTCNMEVKSTYPAISYGVPWEGLWESIQRVYWSQSMRRCVMTENIRLANTIPERTRLTSSDWRVMSCGGSSHRQFDGRWQEFQSLIPLCCWSGSRVVPTALGRWSKSFMVTRMNLQSL